MMLLSYREFLYLVGLLYGLHGLLLTKKNNNMIWWKFLLFMYLLGVVMLFIVAFEGISRHITWKGLKATFILSLFSWLGVWYVILSGGRFNNF